MVFRPIPPIPVATFRNQNLFKSELALCFGGGGCCLSIEIAGIEEVVPGTVVFGSADPNVEIGMNPGAGNQRGKLAEVLVPLDSLRNCNCFEARLSLQRLVETAQKFPSRMRIIFPGIFAIQNDRNHSLMS